MIDGLGDVARAIDGRLIAPANATLEARNVRRFIFVSI